MTIPVDASPPCTNWTDIFDGLIDIDNGKEPNRMWVTKVRNGRQICDGCEYATDCLEVGAGMPGMYGGRMSSERGGLGLGAGAA